MISTIYKDEISAAESAGLFLRGFCQSNDTDMLSAALCEMQAEVTDPPRTAVMKVPNRTDYHYAELEGYLKMLRPLQKKHKISFSQWWKKSACGDWMEIYIKVRHSSGQWEISTYSQPLPKDRTEPMINYTTKQPYLDKNGAPMMKTILAQTTDVNKTFASGKRVQLAGIFGIGQEESNGELAIGSKDNDEKGNNFVAYQQPKELLTQGQLTRLKKDCPEGSERLKHILSKSKISSLDELSKQDAMLYIKQITEAQERQINAA